jgi:general stress protein YciG
MAGTVKGGRKAAQTNKQRYGANFYEQIGRAGGTKSRGGGFAKNRDLAVIAGRKGGQASRRKKAEDQTA